MPLHSEIIPIDGNHSMREVIAHHIPGYAAYIPTKKYMQGQTFSSACAKYLMEREARSRGANIPVPEGIYVPKEFHPTKDCMVGSKSVMPQPSYVATRTGEQYNVETIRERQINEFFNAAQAHRQLLTRPETYQSNQFIAPNPYFNTPVRGAAMFTDD